MRKTPMSTEYCHRSRIDFLYVGLWCPSCVDLSAGQLTTVQMTILSTFMD